VLLRHSDKRASCGENSEFVNAQLGEPSTGMSDPDNTSPKVLIVDDNAHDIASLLDWIRSRGYRIVLATNELAARKLLEEYAAGQKSFVLGLFDVMVPARDLLDLESLDSDETFFQASHGTGVRLCQFVRHTLLIPAARLPLVCYSARDDQELLVALKSLGIPFIPRVGGDFEGHLTGLLPQLETLGSEAVSPNIADGVDDPN
jgi:CheY-like chemotaxis protein